MQLNHYQFQAWYAFSRQKLANNADAAKLGFPRTEHGYSKSAFAAFDTRHCRARRMCISL